MVEAKSLNNRLSCEGLTHSYGEHLILENVDLSVNQGETVAIMGHSGCGKSTLLKCLNLIETPLKGEAFLDEQKYMSQGVPLYELWEIRKDISLVFQEYNLFPNMTVIKNITLALKKVIGDNEALAVEKAKDAASKLGIEKLLHKYPNQLSGGEAQRVALARSLVIKPKVLLLDEITAAIDPESISNVVKALRHLREAHTEGGLAIVLVTHLMRFASEFASRIIFLHEGRFVEDLPAKDFVDCCSHPAAKAFVRQLWAVG